MNGADRDAMSTFRALVKKGEKSERTMEVTGALIRMNPGHYSIWCAPLRILSDANADAVR